MLRAQCRDRDALERLLTAVQPALHRYLAGLVGASDADDVLQDVLVIVVRRIGTLDDPALFRPWTFRVASREAFRHLRKRRLWRERHDEDGALGELPAPLSVSSDEVRQHLLPALVAISPASRAVIMLHYQEELPLREVAAILGIPIGTAKSRLAYGLQSLRKLVKSSGGPND